MAAPTTSFWTRFVQRKLIQWTVAYIAGAWLVMQALDVVSDPWAVPVPVQRGIYLALLVGFFVALTLAWYHGEQGKQRVSGPELLILGMLFALGGLGLSFLGAERESTPTAAIAPEAVDDLAGALEALPGIAVLPFANRSALAEDQYFADGFHDELLTRLQRTSGLRVISRTSVNAYRDTDRPVREIGQELRADYLLEGGVQRSGDRVRINLQLIDAREDVHLWADTYDRVLTPESLFDVQTQVVRTIAGELSITLREEGLQRAARRSTRDPQAYDLFIRGLEAWNRGTEDAARVRTLSQEAAELFGQATRQDPNFLVAHAFASQANARLWGYAGERTTERREAARHSAERAAELDRESEDAQLAMGVYLYRVEKDFDEALRWLGRASGSLRGDYEYHRYRGYTERRMGNWHAAVASLQAALALSPRSGNVWRELGVTYLNMRRYGDAEAALREAVALNPRSASPAFYLAQLPLLRDGDIQPRRAYTERFHGTFGSWELAMSAGDYRAALAILDRIQSPRSSTNVWQPKALLEGWTLKALGDTGAAREAFARAAHILEERIAQEPGDERYHAALGLAYAGLNRPSDAVQEATTATELIPIEKDALSGPFHLFALAAVHAQLGDTEEALAILERLLTIPSRYSAGSLRLEFLLKPLHDDPAFMELLQREPGRVF